MTFILRLIKAERDKGHALSIRREGYIAHLLECPEVIGGKFARCGHKRILPKICVSSRVLSCCYPLWCITYHIERAFPNTFGFECSTHILKYSLCFYNSG